MSQEPECPHAYPVPARLRRLLPAWLALLATSPAAPAAISCADTVSEIQSGFNAAAANPGDDEIRVVSGHYALPGTVTRLAYATTNAGGLRISGGWSSDCTTQARRADATVLDGQHQVSVLQITYQNTGSQYTRFDVANLTLANGAGSAYAGGNGISVYASAPGQTDVRLDNLILQGHSGYFGGAANIYLARGTLTVSNSQFSANSAPTSAYAHLLATIRASDDGKAARLANNTLVDGDCLGNTGGIRGCGVGVSLGESLHLEAVNNLFWHNKLSDLDIEPVANTATARLDSNRLDQVQGAVTPTILRPISGDPGFVQPTIGNFRLQPGSLMIDRGAGRIDGLSLPDRDLDDQPRLALSELDIGAFENSVGPHIFGNGFD